MKRILLFVAAVAFFASCGQTGSKPEAAAGINVAAVKTIELHVTGMTCEGCENSVTTAVAELPGVTTSVASFREELASVSFDTTQVSIETITATINDLGYTVVGELKPEDLH